MDDAGKLSRRERQIMDVIWKLGQATVADVLDQIEDPPSYSAVRALLGILKQKGQVKVEQDGARYVYLPTSPKAKASKSALQRIVQTFFGGEARDAIAALAELPESKLSKDEVDAITKLIESTRKEGR